MIPATSRLEQLALSYHLGRCRYVVCRGIGCPAVLGLIALLERAAAPDWQPIDTAPKDGSFVIGRDLKCGIGKVHWCESYNPHGWADEDGLFVNVRHWMPMPSEPTSDGAK